MRYLPLLLTLAACGDTPEHMCEWPRETVTVQLALTSGDCGPQDAFRVHTSQLATCGGTPSLSQCMYQLTDHCEHTTERLTLDYSNPLNISGTLTVSGVCSGTYDVWLER